jgi:hypothetical protein
MIAIILSIIFPGLGQIYYGKTWRGILMIVLALIPFAYPFILVWSIIDCINLRKKVNPDPVTRKEAITAIVLFFVIIPLFTYVLFIGGLQAIEFITHNYSNPRNTKSELSDIANAVNKYQDKSAKMPTSLYDLIGSKPLRQSWTTDSWGNSYIFTIEQDSSITISSKGKDGVPDTEDDLKIHVPQIK